MRIIFFSSFSKWNWGSCALSCTFLLTMFIQKHNERKMIHNRAFQIYATQLQYLHNIIGNSDIQYVNQLRMDKRTFGLLWATSMDWWINIDGSLTVEEQFCMFLHTLSHQIKNLIIGNRFSRSGETISRYFNSMLNGVL